MVFPPGQQAGLSRMKIKSFLMPRKGTTPFPCWDHSLTKLYVIQIMHDLRVVFGFLEDSDNAILPLRRKDSGRTDPQSPACGGDDLVILRKRESNLSFDLSPIIFSPRGRRIYTGHTKKS